jgi:hypothetical protein
MSRAAASCIGKRWSGPPAVEPPPTVTEPGSACHALARSCTVSYGESAGTRSPSCSSISFARGVTSVTRASESLVYTAPTTPSPIVIMRSSAPSSLRSRCIATLPLAPITFVTSKRPVRSSVSMTCTAARPVWS